MTLLVRMAVLRQLALLLWKNYTLQVGPALGAHCRGKGERGLAEGVSARGGISGRGSRSPRLALLSPRFPFLFRSGRSW